MGAYLSIVSPMFNEESIIGEFIRSVQKTLENFDREWELIVVDDGSCDRSFERAREAIGSDTRIKILQLQSHYGRGRALREGFKAASGKYIITIESDLSWKSSDILKVLAELEKGDADIILVSPYTFGGKIRDVPILRHIISRLGNRVLGAAFPGSFRMVTQMFRGYRREVIDSLMLESNDKEIHLEILSKALAMGFCAREIPGELCKRKGGKSKLKLSHTIQTHLLFSFLERPFLLFGLLGVLFFFVGIGLGTYFIVLWQKSALNPDRPLMTLFIIMIIAGVQMFSFGLLGIMLVNLRREILKMQGIIKSQSSPAKLRETPE